MEIVYHPLSNEIPVAVKDVKKDCPYCRNSKVTFPHVNFNQVTHAECPSCHMTVYIEMLDPFYYRMW